MCTSYAYDTRRFGGTQYAEIGAGASVTSRAATCRVSACLALPRDHGKGQTLGYEKLWRIRLCFTAPVQG
jgi:hypothetical protein